MNFFKTFLILACFSYASFDSNAQDVSDDPTLELEPTNDGINIVNDTWLAPIITDDMTINA